MGALGNCQARYQELSADILDISYVRLVIEQWPEWVSLFEQGSLPIEVQLGPQRFSVSANLQKVGEGWIRLNLDEVLPSAKASLRSFLSPYKIGESILEDWRSEKIRHYHGLNETELWVDDAGRVCMVYLDHQDVDRLLMVRSCDPTSSIQVGKISKKDYLDKMDMGSELELDPLSSDELDTTVGECRDIITNFRPADPPESQMKQKLLREVSEFLYSSRGSYILPHVARNRFDQPGDELR